jgi:hypothetical protein
MLFSAPPGAQKAIEPRHRIDGAALWLSMLLSSQAIYALGT